jgi:hypothetical protein
MQGAKEVQTMQGAMEVVKRLERQVEAIAVTFYKGWSVGGVRRSVIFFHTGHAV